MKAQDFALGVAAGVGLTIGTMMLFGRFQWEELVEEDHGQPSAPPLVAVDSRGRQVNPQEMIQRAMHDGYRLTEMTHDRICAALQEEGSPEGSHTALDEAHAIVDLVAKAFQADGTTVKLDIPGECSGYVVFTKMNAAAHARYGPSFSVDGWNAYAKAAVAAMETARTDSRFANIVENFDR